MRKNPGSSAYQVGSVGASATGKLIDGQPGKQIRITGFLITADADGGSIQFVDSDSNNLSQVHLIGAGAMYPYDEIGVFADTAIGADLEVEISGNVVVDLTYMVV